MPQGQHLNDWRPTVLREQAVLQWLLPAALLAGSPPGYSAEVVTLEENQPVAKDDEPPVLPVREAVEISALLRP